MVFRLNYVVGNFVFAVILTDLPTNIAIQWFFPSINQGVEMPDSLQVPETTKSSLLRWEISVALLIKVTLLIVLWFLIFRWQDRPISKPDIAAHFALPAGQTNFSSQPQQESNHDR